MSPTVEKPSVTDAWSQMSSKLMSWITPALIGAVFVLLMENSGEKAIAAQNAEKLQRVEQAIDVIQRDLAAGGPPALSRRVDDLQTSMQRQYEDLSKKLDVIQATLVARK